MKDRSLRMRGVASYGLAQGLVAAGVLGDASDFDECESHIRTVT